MLNEKPPKTDNTSAGKEARLAILLKAQRERAFSKIYKKFHPLNQEVFTLELQEREEQIIFLQKLSEIITSLLSLDIFEDKSLELKNECLEVLVLVKNKDISQNALKKYETLVRYLFNFFLEKKIYVLPELPE